MDNTQLAVNVNHEPEFMQSSASAIYSLQAVERSDW